MQITLMATGKTSEHYLLQGIHEYTKRIGRYASFSYQEIKTPPPGKKPKPKQLLQAEQQQQLRFLPHGGRLILFDEHGKQPTSEKFASFIHQQQLTGQKDLCFLIGGPYGFTDEIRKQAAGSISLSRMTFPHQLVRLLAIEQIYRALTILNGHPYHNA